MKRCLPRAWQEGQGEGVAFSRGFCTSQFPYSGDLTEDVHPIGYSGAGGIYRLSLREERRTASRMEIQAAAMDVALELDPTTPFPMLVGTEKKKVVEEARLRVLSVCSPRLKVVPVVISEDGWAWVGSKSSTGVPYEVYFSNVFGKTLQDGVVWRPSSGWSSSSYAVLKSAAVRGSRLSSDVSISEVSVKTKDLTLKTGAVEEEGDALLELVESNFSSDSVKRMCFEVYHHGFRVEVGVDVMGVFRVCPPASTGGLPHERFSRRFDDAWHAMKRLGSVLEETVDWADAQD